MKMEVKFFGTKRGDEPVTEYLDTLAEGPQAKIYGFLDTLKKDGYLERPHGKKMKGTGGLNEVISGKHRILYCIHEGEAIMLHAFYKKTNKTPEKELKIAKKRMKLVTGVK